MYRSSTGYQRLDGAIWRSRHFMMASVFSSGRSMTSAVVTGIFTEKVPTT